MRQYTCAARRVAVPATHTRVRALFGGTADLSHKDTGPKSSIYTHRNYIVIVSPPFTPSASAASATVRNFVAKSGGPSGSDITKLTVFDPENQYVAHSGTFTEGVREVFSALGKLYALSNDGKVRINSALLGVKNGLTAFSQLLCLEEKPTSEKLDMLYRKGLYTLALNIAETQKLDEAHIADIHKQYGDHLYRATTIT